MSFGKGWFSINFDETTRMSKYYYLLFPLLFLSCNGGEEKIYPKVTNITESVYSSVTIQPDSLYQAYGVVNGIVEKNLVEEGQLVKKGDPLVQIVNNNPKLTAENARVALELARENYNGSAAILGNIEKEIESARLKYLNDSINYSRQKKLWDQNIGSKSTFENRQLAFELSKSSLEVLENKYRQTRNELRTKLEQAENNYKATQITNTDFTVESKINGKVYALHKEPGELVTSQQPVASVGRADKFVIKMLVDEVDIVKIQQDQQVLLTLDAYPGKVFTARVSKIYPEKDQRNQTFLVEALFEKEPKVLYPGLSGEANIVIEKKENALVIPKDFLVGAGHVKTEDGLTEVKTGLESIDSVEIRSGITSKTAIYKPEEE
ncbi:efflux RND transporter periplasmic adaptor subunit [Salinimicrobium soli]|uniref:efflux RND transporter periplasmic adaptor subunit n=1 Tax=Salinimicrobium soli TaxID=1254399 RepID=UPI003AAE8818